MLAIQASPSVFEAVVPEPAERITRYAVSIRLPAGLRSEVCLGLPRDCASLDQLVVIKRFFPHVPGPALDALREELALAQRLRHPNIVHTLHVCPDAERPLMVSEYLEGATLRALLQRVSLARAGVATAAVARLLCGVVLAVCHAERLATSPASRKLVAQAIAADDVFVTFDGAVKLLGFKARLADAAPSRVGSEPEPSSSEPAAIDALLAEHMTPELGRVLAASLRSGEHARHGLRRVGRAIERWQADVLGSDGRAELAALMGLTFPSERLARRAQLEGRLQRSRGPTHRPLVDGSDEGAPPSGIRRVHP